MEAAQVDIRGDLAVLERRQKCSGRVSSRGCGLSGIVSMQPANLSILAT